MCRLRSKDFSITSNQELPTSFFKLESDQKTLRPFEHNSCQMGFTISSSALEKLIKTSYSNGSVILVASTEILICPYESSAPFVYLFFETYIEFYGGKREKSTEHYYNLEIRPRD
jgi:hypothetical protein